MSGIYIHIPFCKKACHYCDFHFSTSLKNKEAFLSALCKEIEIRKDAFKDKTVNTIYLGGGTPSLLEVHEIDEIISTVKKYYSTATEMEITLEANPDDLTKSKIVSLSKTLINRLSIGVQSFGDKELQMMNRAHNANNVKDCLTEATKYFKNITIDLMYGIPGLSTKEWECNIDQTLSFGIHHISSYALTVEEGTALFGLIKKGVYPKPEEKLAAEHFEILVSKLTNAGFDHYEISNFGKPNFYAQHNTSYWLGKPYLGFGPSAHSYLNGVRSWNVSNNTKYIKAIHSGELPCTKECLTVQDEYNEYLMTGLRTIWGVSLQKIANDFGEGRLKQLKKNIQVFINNKTLVIEDNHLKTTPKGKFLADGIASDLFWVD